MQLKVIVFGATGASLPTVNVPAVSVGRAESARRFVELKLIVAAALLKPPYRALGIVQPKDIQRESNALPYGEVATPVSLVGAIIDRPHQSASANVPSIP